MTLKRNSALSFIYITVLIDFMGIGLIAPIIPKLLEQLSGKDLSGASAYSGWLSFAYATFQFLCAPVLGNLSDRYGRRPILLISLLGLGIDYIFLAFSPTLALLFIGRVIAGICGASFTTAGAYIADISTNENRAQNFGMIGAAFGVGFMLGPAIGGMVSGWGVRAPFMVAAGLSLLNAIFGYFILPESLSPDHRRAFEWKRANPVGALVHIRKYPVILGLVGSLFFIYLAGQGLQNAWSFYTMLKFNWDARMVGYSLAFVGLMTMIVQGGLIRLIIPKVGNKMAVFLGLGLYCIGMLLFALANQGWMMFAILVPYCLGGICGPAIQGIISTQVPPNEQGELQGGLTSVMSLTAIIGPPLMMNLFAHFSKPNAPVFFPGAPFLAAAICCLVSLLLSMRSLAHYVAPKVQVGE